VRPSSGRKIYVGNYTTDNGSLIFSTLVNVIDNNNNNNNNNNDTFLVIVDVVAVAHLN
jgi:hypothetical protein